MKSYTALNLLKSPLWLIQLFTGAKSFRDNPILGNVWLNKAGLHVIRLLAAHTVMRLRMAVLGFRVSKADRDSYQRYGYVLKENYLSDTDFQALAQEIRACPQTPRRTIQGDTETQRTLLAPEILESLPQTAALLANEDFCRLLRYTNGHRRLPFFNIECIHNGIDPGQDRDPQTDMHSDTFHPTMKFWLYLDDVTEHNGPFTYIPGSNRLTSKRLRWEYQMSQQARTHPNRLVSRGSFRFSANDRETLELPPPKAFKVRKNTLLIANTFGVHGRGQAEPDSKRLAIWGMGRTNPFLPFAGIGGKTANLLQYRVLQWIRERES